jgi:hypothetical protein
MRRTPLIRVRRARFSLRAAPVKDRGRQKNVKVTLPIKEAVAALKKGDYVLLDWQHDYVTREGASFPERVVQKLQKISRAEADKLTGGLDKLPPPPKVNPAIQPRGGISPR